MRKRVGCRQKAPHRVRNQVHFLQPERGTPELERLHKKRLAPLHRVRESERSRLLRLAELHKERTHGRARRAAHAQPIQRVHIAVHPRKIVNVAKVHRQTGAVAVREHGRDIGAQPLVRASGKRCAALDMQRVDRLGREPSSGRA
eukprot:Amastigsp_a512810_35.p2 type:complete len:145 gc:universal Amastigsp_a512810_35:635-1069(+)